MAYARTLNPPPAAANHEDDGIDAFTAWILKWQHFILPCLAILFIASFL